MAKAVKQTLREVVQSGRAPTYSESEIPNVAQTKSVVNKKVHSVLSNSGLIVWIAITVGNQAYREVDEYRFCEIEGTQYKLLAPICLWNVPVCPRRPWRIPSDSLKHNEPCRNSCHHRNTFRRNHHKEKVSQGLY